MKSFTLLLLCDLWCADILLACHFFCSLIPSLEKQPDRFAEITRAWADNTPSADGSDFDIKFAPISQEDYIKSHREIFKDTKTVFDPEVEGATLASSVRAMASKGLKMVAGLMGGN